MQNHNNYLSKNQAKLNNPNKHTNLGKKEMIYQSLMTWLHFARDELTGRKENAQL